MKHALPANKVFCMFSFFAATAALAPGELRAESVDASDAVVLPFQDIWPEATEPAQDAKQVQLVYIDYTDDPSLPKLKQGNRMSYGATLLQTKDAPGVYSPATMCVIDLDTDVCKEEALSVFMARNISNRLGQENIAIGKSDAEITIGLTKAAVLMRRDSNSAIGESDVELMFVAGYRGLEPAAKARIPCSVFERDERGDRAYAHAIERCIEATVNRAMDLKQFKKFLGSL
jgi:hypothetical protein